jgi:hypothetical protein
MPRKHIKSLKVTEMRSMEYSEFHNCPSALCKGLNCDIWQVGRALGLGHFPTGYTIHNNHFVDSTSGYALAVYSRFRSIYQYYI